jgi:TRAP-type C4-dicarboxylate transport system substrate-binding protein
MYEPVLMSKKVYESLTPEQQKAIMDAGKASEAYFSAEIRKGDDKMVETFKKANVEVVEMSKEDFDAWLAVAKESSYKKFAEEVDGGDRLIEQALTVQ